MCVLFFAVSLANAQQSERSGLRRIDSRAKASAAECPLKHTAVRAEITGMLSRVTVVQQFINSFAEAIEAVYIFPLPHDASVDRMTMTIGGRKIKGVMKTREEAYALYEKARRAGQAASRLDQERPNIFTQSIANIVPGAEIQIEISYFQVLKYERGDYEFVFPMVVGPRYKPATLNTGDAERITPPEPARDAAPGHGVSLEAEVDAGVPLGNIDSKTHEIEVVRLGSSRARVRLRNSAETPNRDFILRYDAAGKAIETSLLAHRAEKGGFFTLIVQPPERAAAVDVAPKELIFVLDTSGSMSGFPIEKAKETMSRAFASLSPRDTFNLITFSGDTEILFPVPVPGTPENLQIAQIFLRSRSGRGGTEMMTAIRAALEPSGESGRVRVVCFMTDGYVGNDFEILAEVRKHPEARVFAFGIGSAVNRFLLDGMAYEGRGEVEYVGLKDDAEAAVKRFEQRVREPILTSISLDWGTLPVTDVYPTRIPDLFSAKPVVVTGRYAGAARGAIAVRGWSGGREITLPVAVDLPAAEAAHDSLASYWARQRVAELMSQDYAGVQSGSVRPELRAEITKAGIEYGVMTQFTSFIAVEERVVTFQGKTRRVEVPVALPEGVSHAGVFGAAAGMGGTGRGVAGGVVGGVIGGLPLSGPPPSPAIAAGSVFAAHSTGDIGLVGTPTAKMEQRLMDLARSSTATVATVQIQLREASQRVIDALAAAGFVMTQPPNRARQVRGRIDSTRLVELAKLADVRYVVEVRR
jgi:Ca-activated chloride channel family protein